MQLKLSACLLGACLLPQTTLAAVVNKEAVVGYSQQPVNPGSSLNVYIGKREEKILDEESAAEINSYLAMNEDQWVAYLARASPGHFEDIVKKIKKLLGKGDCDDEEEEDKKEDDCDDEPAEEAPEEDCDDGAPEEAPAEEPEDDCEDDDEDEYYDDEEEEEKDCEDGDAPDDGMWFGDRKMLKAKRSLTKTSQAKSAKKVKAKNTTQTPQVTDEELAELAKLLHGLKKNTASEKDVTKALQSAGDFDYSAFGLGAQNSSEEPAPSEQLNYDDAKDKRVAQWLKKTATRRAELLQKVLDDEQFNDTAAFEAEEFQYRKGNIFLPDDENDDDYEDIAGPSVSVPSTVLALAAIAGTFVMAF